MNKNDLEKVLARQSEKTERYLGALKEDFNYKLGAVLEAVQDMPEIKRKAEL